MGRRYSFYPSKGNPNRETAILWHIRGLVNGDGGRKPRTAAKGHGLINGNGLTNGNLPANGSTKIKLRDIINSTGLVNGNGLTNGNGLSCGDSQQEKYLYQRERKKRIAARGLVFVVVIILPLLFVNFRPPYNEGNGIYIDGNPGDWKNISGCDDSSEDQMANPNVNIVNYRLFHDDEETRPWNSKLSFYLEVKGYIFGNPQFRIGNELTSYAVYIFIDSDCNPKTGYEIQGLGADLAIELEGHDGIVHTSGLLEFEEGHNPKDWNGFKGAKPISWALSEHVLETQIRSNPGISGKFDVLFHATDSNENGDFSDTVLSNERGQLIITSETVAPGILAIGDTDVCLLKLDLLAQEADIELAHLNVTIIGNSEPSDIDEICLFVDDGDKIHTQSDSWIASASPLGRNAFLKPHEPVRVGMGNISTLFVTATVSSEASLYSVTGLSISSREDIDLDKGTVTLHSDMKLSYIGAVPETIRIDGAFADWDGIYSHEDKDHQPVKRQSTDMREYKVTANEGSLYLYLDVEGTMMGGTAVPMVPRYQSYSDIPVNKFLSKKRVQESSEGEFQPHSDVPQELMGEDSIYIFFDSDQNATTGYSPSWLPLGAEHMVHLSGKDGEVLDTTVMKYWSSSDDSYQAGFENPFLIRENGAGYIQWVASNSQEIEVETRSSELEARMDTGFLNAGETVDIFFVAANWNIEVIDTADSVISETLEKSNGLRSYNPYISGHVHPYDAENSDGDTMDHLNLDEDAPGDGVYEISGDSSEPGSDWIEVSFPGAGIPSGAAINNITYYLGYNTTNGWTLVNDTLSNITWRVGATEYNAGNYTLSAPAGTDIDATLVQSTNLPLASDLNSGSFTVRFRGIDGGSPAQDNLYLDYCYFILNYSIPNIVINEVMYKPICGPYDVDWMFRKKITFNSSLVPENQTNFPVLVNITDTDLQSKARSDGYDILFTDSDGETKLDHEIETYNTSTGSLFSWVRIPSLSSTTDTDIYMYYGNHNAQDQSNPAGVWDANFTGIWHMAEEQTGIGNPGVYLDSTSNDNHGDDNVSDTGKDGRINGGQMFNGSGDHITVPHNQSLNLKGAMTISFWIYPTQATSMWNRIVEKGMWGYQTAYYFGCGDGTNDLTFYLNNTSVFDTGDNVISANTWQHAAVSYNSTGDAVLYLNGVPIDSGSYTEPIPGNSDVIYISHSNPAYDFPGAVDEVRISNTARSHGWIATFYNNTNSSDLFCTLGSEEDISIPDWVAPNGSSNWLYRKEITIDSGNVVGDLIDFPVLIDIKDDDLKNRARSDGRDILFTGTDMQTILDYEIEYYSNTLGKLVAWVKIPDLSSTIDTSVYMYYGNPNAYDFSNADALWSNNFSAVWHLSESPADSPPQFEDTTSNDNNGTAVGSMTPGDQVNGKMDGSIDFDGADDRINIPQNLSLDSSDNVTMSGWFRLDNPHTPSSPSSNLILEKYLDANYNLAIILAGSDYDEGTGGLSQGAFVFKINLQSGGDAYAYKWTSQTSWSANKWYHYVCILNVTDITKNKIYINGIEDVGGQREGTLNGTLNYSSDWNIGGGNVETMNIPSGVAYFDGRLDETRIATTIRSDDWIATEYNNQNSSDKFHSLGHEQILLYQWVELYNNATTSVNLSGWMLSDYDGNTFNLSGADSLPSGGYLICHINRFGTNSSADIFGSIINTGAQQIVMFEGADDIALLDSQGYMVDYIAWGADQGPDDDSAVLGGLWDDGDFIDTSLLSAGQTIGRDMNSNDTDQPEDWQNATGYADPFGIHRSTVNGSTPGLQNWDRISEFSDIVIPFTMMLLIFAVWKRKNRRVKENGKEGPAERCTEPQTKDKGCEQ